MFITQFAVAVGRSLVANFPLWFYYQSLIDLISPADTYADSPGSSVVAMWAPV